MPDLFPCDDGAIASLAVKEFMPGGEYIALSTISQVYRATGYEDADRQAAEQLLPLAERVVEELKRRIG